LAGSSLLVVGRPIRDAAEPLQIAERIVAEIAEACA
jgi:orotidine-5'-phosphate decarboxylase